MHFSELIDEFAANIRAELIISRVLFEEQDFDKH